MKDIDMRRIANTCTKEAITTSKSKITMDIDVMNQCIIKNVEKLSK